MTLDQKTAVFQLLLIMTGMLATFTVGIGQDDVAGAARLQFLEHQREQALRALGLTTRPPPQSELTGDDKSEKNGVDTDGITSYVRKRRAPMSMGKPSARYEQIFNRDRNTRPQNTLPVKTTAEKLKRHEMHAGPKVQTYKSRAWCTGSDLCLPYARDTVNNMSSTSRWQKMLQEPTKRGRLNVVPIRQA